MSWWTKISFLTSITSSSKNPTKVRMLVCIVISNDTVWSLAVDLIIVVNLFQNFFIRSLDRFILLIIDTILHYDSFWFRGNHWLSRSLNIERDILQFLRFLYFFRLRNLFKFFLNFLVNFNNFVNYRFLIFFVSGSLLICNLYPLRIVSEFI